METGKRERIQPVASLQEFFRTSVEDAMRRQGISAHDHTSYYVVNLLTLFARSESFFDETEDGIELKPLAKVLAESAGSPRVAERNYALQRVGDVSLFVAGFLGDGLARKLVDIDYYVLMGGTAYGTLSENVRGSARGRLFARVFAELAEKFQEFVDVLAGLRDETSMSQTDVLRTYDTWLSTGSRRAERMLRACGIEPNRSDDFKTRH